jgi:hypothetical protein
VCVGVVNIKFKALQFSLQELRVGEIWLILGLLTLRMGSSILFVP